ncbi:MAG: hypothetical protein WKF58_02495 [Ilumatobacteraceae bacterium]
MGRRTAHGIGHRPQPELGPDRDVRGVELVVDADDGEAVTQHLVGQSLQVVGGELRCRVERMLLAGEVGMQDRQAAGRRVAPTTRPCIGDGGVDRGR